MENEKDTHNEHSRLLPKQSTGSITRRNVIISDSEVEDHCFSTSVEIAILLFFFAKVLSDLLMTNFLEFVTCKNVYHYNNSICTDPISPHVENLVQPIVANVIMVRMLTEAFFPSLFVLFVGPWSDKNGRKPFLLLSLFGLSFSYAFWGFLSVIPNIRPELFLLASIPVVLTGGPCTVFVLGYCYVCDVTTIDERVLRMAFLQFVYSIANLFGALSLPQLFRLLVNFQYTSIFFISSGLLMLAVIFVSSCLSETIIVHDDQGTKFFQLEHIEELFAVCFKERPFHGRIIVLLISVGLAITVFVNQGESSLVYLSLRKLFGWQLEDFSFYASCTMIFNCTGGLVGIYFFISVLEYPVMPTAVAVAFCRVIQAAINATASQGYYFYISSVIGSMIYMLGALSRLEISKVIPQQEVGKVMAFISFLEAICPIAAAPLYTIIYDLTLETFPNAIYWLSTVLCMIPVLFLIIVVTLQYLQKDYRYSGMDPLEVQ